MSVVFFTVAELAVLSTMLGGLLHKRAHPHPRAARLAVVEPERTPTPV